MKKVLLILLIVLSVYLVISLYFLDKHYFLCPIEYKRDIIIRCDNRGDGFFAASRKGNRLHNGVDLFAEIGTPVMAVRSGRIITADSSCGSLGSCVIIQHFSNIMTVYGHLSEICVSRGRFVRQGKIIGSVGKTGNANHPGIQPHLHFEIRKNDTPQDPSEYLQ